MEGREGWRMIRCCGGADEENSVLNQIMMRFRPIAPKPVNGGSGSGVPRAGNSTSVSPKGKAKRKFVRVRNNPEENVKGRADSKLMVTLQLLPETEKSGVAGDHSKHGGSSCCEFDDSSLGTNHPWLSLSKIERENNSYMRDGSAADPTAVMGQMGGGVESWVTVECVKGTCMRAPPPPQGYEVITTDEERVRSLEADTCPGFVSDGWNRVRWLNGAFKRMVTTTWPGQSPEIGVLLSMNEELSYGYSAFTCQVKVRYPVGNNMEKQKYCCYSQMVPCDLWRMDGGGFAWRLDVKAALSLAVDAAPLHI